MTDARALEAQDGSVRVQLAATAERVVAAMPGVALTTMNRPAWQTAGRARRIEGITAMAQPDSRYELTLHLVVAWPAEPLLELTDELRRRVVDVAGRDGLADRLGDVQIDVVDIRSVDDADGVRP